MTTINRAFAIAMAMGLAGAAQAAVDPGELTVGGQVKTPACVVTLSGGGVFDYGLMSMTILPRTGHLALPAKKQTMTVDCGSATTYVAYSVRDAREGTASGAGTRYDLVLGLGSMPGRATSKIGYYEIAASNAKVDGRDTSFGVVNTAGGSIYGYPIGNLDGFVRVRSGYYGENVSTWTSRAGYAPLSAVQAGSQFSIDLEVRPFLASTSVVGGGEPLTDAVNMDGLALVTFAFGL